MITTWIKKKVLGYLTKVCGSQMFQEKLVKEINERIDIPVLTEKEEKQLFEVLIEVLTAVILIKK